MNKELAEYKVSNNFQLNEFLPIELLDGKIPLKTLLAKIPTKIIDIAQGLRNRHGKITINNKYRGGVWNYRCLRLPACKEYNPKSMHAFAKAIDWNPNEKTIDDIWDDIEKNPQFYKDLGVTRIESRKLATSWLHFDIFNHLEKNTIQVIMQKGLEKRL